MFRSKVWMQMLVSHAKFLYIYRYMYVNATVHACAGLMSNMTLTFDCFHAMPGSFCLDLAGLPISVDRN